MNHNRAMSSPTSASTYDPSSSKVATSWNIEDDQEKTVLVTFLCLTGGLWLALSSILTLLLCKERQHRKKRLKGPLPHLSTLKNEWQRGAEQNPSMLRISLIVVWILAGGALIGIAIMRFGFPVLHVPLNNGDQRILLWPWPLRCTAFCKALRVSSQNSITPVNINLLPLDGINQETQTKTRVTNIYFKHGEGFNKPKNYNKTRGSSTSQKDDIQPPPPPAIQAFAFFLWSNDKNERATKINGNVTARTWLWAIKGRQQYTSCMNELEKLDHESRQRSEAPQSIACSLLGPPTELSMNQNFEHNFYATDLNGDYFYLIFLLRDVISKEYPAYFYLTVRRNVLELPAETGRNFTTKLYISPVPEGIVLDFEKNKTSNDKVTTGSIEWHRTLVKMECDIDGKLLTFLCSIIPTTIVILYSMCTCILHGTPNCKCLRVQLTKFSSTHTNYPKQKKLLKKHNQRQILGGIDMPRIENQNVQKATFFHPVNSDDNYSQCTRPPSPVSEPMWYTSATTEEKNKFKRFLEHHYQQVHLDGNKATCNAKQHCSTRV